ncbi:MAG: hypothetical protein NUV78_00505 [Candidatus Zambryskibacteria bacterium]|nr:hypothetical protein [Candidatus Zambryskibacteria bacterium]
MRKLFTKLSAFILVLSFVFALSGISFVENAQAEEQLGFCSVGVGATATLTTKAKCVGNWESLESFPDKVQQAIENDADNPGFWARNLQNFFAWIAQTILTLTSLLTGIAGLVLNGVIFHTIVKVADNYENLTAISEAWKTIRDVANMGFIFILLYAAIMTIIGQGVDNQKLIVKVIVVAILINFSLFFTSVVIDISNLLTLVFYEAMVPGALSKGLTFGLSNAFMEQLNLQSLYYAKESAGTLNLTNTAIITTGVMGSIMLLIAAFVFFAVALLFIIRYVVLIILIILSPIAFVAYILPQMQKYGDQWKDALIGQAFFAPIYMMLTWVTLRILSGITKSLGAGDGTLSAIGDSSNTAVAGFNNIPQYQGFFPTFINFAVVIAFLIISLVIAKEWANKAPGGVSALNSWATGKAGNLSFGLAGRIGRNTVGRGAEAFKESAAYKRLQTQAPKSRMARLALATANKTAAGSFDTRGTGVGGAMGGMMGAGSAFGQGGYEAKKKQKEKEQKEREGDARKAGAQLLIDKVIAGSATPQEITDMQKLVKDMSSKEIVALDHNTLSNEKVAEALTAAHLKAIDEDKDGKFSESEKKDVFEKHFAKVEIAVEELSNPAIALTTAQETAHKNTIKNISDKEIDFIPANIFDPTKLDPSITGADADRSRTFLKTLTQPQVDNLTKGERLIASDKQAVKDARNRPLNDAFVPTPGGGITDPVEAIRIMSEMRPENLVQLEDSKLTHPEILTLYRPALLNKMAARSELTDAKANAIRNAVMTAANAPGIVPIEIVEAALWLDGDGLKIF